jgi:ketosteroid isomerase-like protein
MSRENVEIVRRVYEALSTPRAMPLDLFHSDFEADARDVAPDIGVVRGGEGFREAFRSYSETFDAFRIEIEQVINADRGRVVTAVRDGGRIRGSDAELWNHFFHVWTFGDGKITRFSTHTERGRALEAAGLTE